MNNIKAKPLKVQKTVAKIPPMELTAPVETASERQLRLARKLKGSSSYQQKLRAFNERLAKTTDFNDLPKMKS
jgi:hypothetical protein